MNEASALRHPASYWRKLPNQKAQCLLCPFNCSLAEGKTGICKGKTNIGGTLMAVNYGMSTSLSMDPMEKKPLYHFLPGSQILSAGPNGCNLGCDFCQNYHVSQSECDTTFIPPAELAEIAQAQGSVGVAYTYAEPLIWYEYVMDAARAVRELGMVNVLVTNGYINEEPLFELLPLIDAMNLDIKSMDPVFYKKVCKSSLAPVLRTAEIASRQLHLEVTNLLIPGLNDSPEGIGKLVDFVAGLGEYTPLHFSRYFPQYKRSTPPTPAETLKMAAKIASEKLHHVFIGNIDAGAWNNTACHGCGELVIERKGYRTLVTNLKGGRCGNCGMDTGIVTRE